MVTFYLFIMFFLFDITVIGKIPDTLIRSLNGRIY
jgi:hypothetical protein